jgi:hypothetical protein
VGIVVDAVVTTTAGFCGFCVGGLCAGIDGGLIVVGGFVGFWGFGVATVVGFVGTGGFGVGVCGFVGACGLGVTVEGFVVESVDGLVVGGFVGALVVVVTGVSELASVEGFISSGISCVGGLGTTGGKLPIVMSEQVRKIS